MKKKLVVAKAATLGIYCMEIISRRSWSCVYMVLMLELKC
jgi:hypothetical protein